MTQWIASWDCYGLEALANVDTLSAEVTWNILKDPDKHTNPLNRLVCVLMLRARANHQRNYEIYTFEADPAISETYIREMFQSNPQGMADLIRERGNKIFSDRETGKRVIT